MLAFRTAWSLDAADFRVLAAVPDVAQAVRLHDVEVALRAGVGQVFDRGHRAYYRYAGAVLTPDALFAPLARYALGAALAWDALVTLYTVHAPCTLFALGATFAGNALFAPGSLLAFRTAWSLDAADFRVLAAVPDVAQAVRLDDVEVALRAGVGQVFDRGHRAYYRYAGAVLTPDALFAPLARYTLGAALAWDALVTLYTIHAPCTLFALGAPLAGYALLTPGSLLAFRTAWSLDAADFRVLAAVPDVAQAVRLDDVEVALRAGVGQVFDRGHRAYYRYAGAVLTPDALFAPLARNALGAALAWDALVTLYTIHASCTLFALGAPLAGYALLTPGALLAFRTAWSLDAADFRVLASVPDVA